MPKPSDPLEAALATLRKLSFALPGAEEYVMVHHPAFRVGKKPFAIVGMDHAPTVSINLGPDAQADLLSDERFSRTHYIGQHGWVTVDYDSLSAGEVASLVEGSWQRVAGKRHLTAHTASKVPDGGGRAPTTPQEGERGGESERPDRLSCRPAARTRRGTKSHRPSSIVRRSIRDKLASDGCSDGFDMVFDGKLVALVGDPRKAVWEGEPGGPCRRRLAPQPEWN